DRRSRPMFEAIARGRTFLLQRSRRIPIRWLQRDDASWLARNLPGTGIRPRRNAYAIKIESLAAATNALGPQPLWEGYGENNRNGPTRVPAEVRTPNLMGELFTQLVTARRPRTIVEFGTAFGVSGMYFLAGLQINGGGELLTFEP